MHTWFKRWLRENGSEGRVPNMASAFIFDIIKRSPGQGPDWSFLEYKTQTCAFCWGGARVKARCALSQPCVSIGGRVARKEHLSPGNFVRGSLMGIKWGKKELNHGIWSSPFSSPHPRTLEGELPRLGRQPLNDCPPQCPTPELPGAELCTD